MSLSQLAALQILNALQPKHAEIEIVSILVQTINPVVQPQYAPFRTIGLLVNVRQVLMAIPIEHAIKVRMLKIISKYVISYKIKPFQNQNS